MMMMMISFSSTYIFFFFFFHFCSHFSACNLLQVGRSLQVLIAQVQQFVFEHNSASSSSSSTSSPSDLAQMQFPGLKRRRAKRESSATVTASATAAAADESAGRRRRLREVSLLQQRSVLQVLDRLKLCAHRCQYTPQQPLAEMRGILAALEDAFNRLVDMTLAGQLRALVDQLDSPSSSPVSLRTSLHTLILLGNEGSTHLCALLAREGAVRAALRHCAVSEDDDGGDDDRPAAQGAQAEFRVLALRALSSVCCVAECIREFEKVGGQELFFFAFIINGKTEVRCFFFDSVLIGNFAKVYVSIAANFQHFFLN